MLSGNGKRLEAAVIFFEDIMFSLLSAVLFSVIFYRFSWGSVRWYALAAALLGFTAYRVTVGRAVMACASSIIGLILRIVRFVKKLVGRIVCAVRHFILCRMVRPVLNAGRKLIGRVLFPYYLHRSERLKKRVVSMAGCGFAECETDNFIKRWIRSKKEKKTKSRPTHRE